MGRARVAARKIALALVAVASVAGAAALIWMFVTRDSVPTLSTMQLLAMLALFLLPGVTYAAWELDRRAVRERGPVEDDGLLESNGLFERPEGVEIADESEGRRERGGHGRRGRGPPGAASPAAARGAPRRGEAGIGTISANACKS